MRANRCGYRTALANHAFIYRTEESFFVTPAPNQQERDITQLKQRYPEYEPSMAKYFSGPQREAEHLLSGLLPDDDDRLNLLVDLSSVCPHHNGTFEACKEILARAARAWPRFNIFAMASEEAVRFHQLNELDRISFVSSIPVRRYAIAFRFGQPLSYEHVFRMSRMAPVNVYGMLDPIKYDCLYLNDVDLDTIWGAVFAHADGVIYISDFVKEQFARRFPMRQGLQELVTYMSLDYRDYARDEVRAADDGYILVMGNSFAHKRVPATIDALSEAFPREKIVAFGLPEDRRPNVIAYQSGHLSEEQMDLLMRCARFVVFPSIYEGFGFPVVKSLAYRKPIFARSIPTNRAICEKLGEDKNLILYCSTNDLVSRLRRGFPAWHDGTVANGPAREGWDAVVEQIGHFLCRVSQAVSFGDVLVPRLRHMRLLEAGQQAKPSNSSAANTASSKEELTTALQVREAQIQDIYHSWSWRVTAPMRRIADACLSLKKRKNE
jgi:glycosyltransferase involved in cell wall biosynthesis